MFFNWFLCHCHGIMPFNWINFIKMVKNGTAKWSKQNGKRNIIRVRENEIETKPANMLHFSTVDLAGILFLMVIVWLICSTTKWALRRTSFLNCFFFSFCKVLWKFSRVSNYKCKIFVEKHSRLYFKAAIKV